MVRLVMASKSCILLFATFSLSHTRDISNVVEFGAPQIAVAIGNTMATESLVEHVGTAVSLRGRRYRPLNSLCGR